MGSFKSPRWISHRGYCKHEIENTQGAFDEAVNLGFDRIETDLRVSKDNHIVLSHDENLTRTGGPDKKINDLTRSELKDVDLKYYKKLMFFEDFVDRYCAKDWIFDIKPEHGSQTIASLKAWAEYNQAHNLLTKQAWFLVWDPKHEEELKAFLPNANILADEKKCWRAGLSLYFGLSFFGGFVKDMVYSLPFKKYGRTFFKSKIVKKIHKKQSKALAYLPQNEEESKAAATAGFDYILTDFPPYRPRRVFSNDNRRGGFDNRRSSGRPHQSDRGRPHSSDNRGPRSHDNRSYNRKPNHSKKPFEKRDHRKENGRRSQQNKNS